MKKLDEEVNDALSHVRSGCDFIMTGGAGSGKTHSMLQFLEELYIENPSVSVACITYTNVAVNEIRDRFPTPKLYVSTIHEFLWSLISRFQKNVHESLASLVNDSTIKTNLATPVNASFWPDPIVYKEWLNITEGEISHDELLKVACDLFEKHPTLAKILQDQYDFILIDEYQDTPPEVLRILLEALPAPTVRALRLGFFGDREQAIYEGDKGSLIISEATESGRLKSIQKDQNRRNPASVIKVINNLRTDDLLQVQSSDQNAPNFGKQGTARFIYTMNSSLRTSQLRELSFCKDWSFESETTKLLFLGKSMIAREKQFPELMAIYDKDRVVEYAKKIKAFFTKNKIEVDPRTLFGQVLSNHGDSIKPTGVLQKAFETDECLLRFAADYTLEDIATTSTNSDKLLGTKKVSDFDNRDRGEKRDALISHLIAIEELRALYRSGKYSAVIRAIDSTITSIEARASIITQLGRLAAMDEAPIGDVIEFAHAHGLVKRKDALLKQQEKHPYRFDRVIQVKFLEVANLYEYVEDYSPYSTQHGVKGSEWDNIFVALDNGGWNNYNFNRLLAEPQGKTSVHSRSRMMLYVTCSRARDNLVVYVHNPDAAVLQGARKWFGDENVECVDSIISV